jgi:hypothetical protein
MANADEEIRRMMAEDELDAAREGITKMTVIEYGRARGILPQLIYYHVRTGKIKQELCVCGRKVIDVAGADAFFAEKEEADHKKAGGVGNTES